MSTVRHTPYICLEQMVVRVEPGVMKEIPAIIRNLAPGEQLLAKLCITIGAVTDFGYITPVVTISRNGAVGGVQSVDFFEWEGSVIYSGNMTEEQASFFLYPTGPLR
jgi:hypothetical protein